MALVAGNAPFYEKYGMVEHKRFCPYGDTETFSTDMIFKLKFNFPTPCGTSTDYIKIEGNYIRVCVPVHYGSPEEGYWAYSEYQLLAWQIGYANRIYSENTNTGLRIRYEVDNSFIGEILILPSGTVQVTNNGDYTYSCCYEYGFGTADTTTQLSFSHQDAKTIVYTAESGHYTVKTNQYDNSSPFALPSKIIDTIYVKNKSEIQIYNVYSLTAGIDNATYQKFRVKTPNGIGYIYSEPVSALASGELGFCIGTQKYALRPHTKSVTPSTVYEYSRLATWNENYVTKNTLTYQYVGYGSGYWYECTQYVLNSAYDVPVYNVLAQCCTDVYGSSNMTSPSSAATYAAINGTSWFSTGNSSKGQSMQWFASLNSDPNSVYTTYNSLQNFSFEPYSYYGRYGYYKWNQNVVAAYVMIATTTVV